MIIRFLGAQWLAVGFVGVISLAVSILIARTLGPDSFGVYSVVLSGGAIAAILLDGGFGRLLQRERAHPTPALLRFLPILPQAALGHVIIAASIFSLIALLVLPKHALTIVAVIWFFAASVTNQFGLNILRGDGRMVRDASWQMGNRTFTAACVCIVILMGAEKPWQVFFAQFVGATAFGLLIMHYLRTRPLWKIPPTLYAATLPFVWLDLATVLYFRADMLLLEWLDVSKFEVGKYGVACRLIEAVILLASPLCIILFRKFRLGSASPRLMLRRMLPVLAGALMVGVFFMVFFWLCSTPLIAVAYGEAYAGADHILAILGCALLFILPNGVLNQAALALGIERWLAMSASFAAVLNIAGNLWLIPQYGLIGAAWMTVVTEAVLGCCVALGLWRHRNRSV
ncbi:polysaccharide biosynthesis C-terminal domain-containing protein [Methylobacillus flagellatus]|uniref:Polysaccharide export protein n=1 Tax=Methylobacillus flagellatus (strain ATCC 51484 / DSM 6875 / VKM B-1610 / KT) TaxID=265072 RepID=Q1H1U5_METFK|nr:polysaccharide biosynthesis C-terminal domain-containing protein [Methylobacillus flagellatus]ABE49542.1 polysaccharide export protein [Methylobacillus flagellatus KT]